MHTHGCGKRNIFLTEIYFSFNRPRGTDNLCCYDLENKLIDSRQAEGGFLQRYHYLGGEGTIPYLTNFYYDVLPYLHCCRYQKSRTQNDICSKFFNYRQPSSCLNYDPPRPVKYLIFDT